MSTNDSKEIGYHIEELLLLPQDEPDESEDYEFNNGVDLYTTSFLMIFDKDALRIAYLAKLMILEHYQDAPCSHIQKFKFKNIEFWAVSTLSKNLTKCGASWYWGSITFMLASEY